MWLCVRMCVIVFHVTNYVWIKKIQALGLFLLLTRYQPLGHFLSDRRCGLC